MGWWMIIIKQSQHYPPGTQNNYVGFLNLFVITETGKELNYQKDGGWGLRGWNRLRRF